MTTAQRPHGTRGRYVLGPGPGQGPGCRCTECTCANRDAASTRNRAILYGRWQPYVDAGPVREHLLALSAAGIGARRAAALAGVSAGAVSKLLHGGPGDRPPSQRIRPATAAALLAVQPSPGNLAPGALTGATGTRRRLQALVACGWSQARLARELGLTPANFGGMLRGGQVTAATARAVSGLYDRLWNQPPPEHDQRTKIAASRARGYAAQRAWPPPLAWDDDTIDDPAASPVDDWKRPATARLSSADLAHDAGELIRLQGYTRKNAAARLGISLASVEQAFRRTRDLETGGQPAGYQAEAG